MAQSRVRAASRSFNLPNGDGGEGYKATSTERTTTDIAKGGARPCYQTGTKHQVMDGRHDTTAAPNVNYPPQRTARLPKPRCSTSVPFRYVPKARVRCYQSVTTSYRHLAALRFLRLAIPRMHSLFSFSARRVHWQSLELVTRYLQPGIAEEQKSRTLPSSWGTSMFRLPCSNPTPAGLLMSDHCDTAAWPPVCKKQRLPRKVFRSSIAWLSNWLSTLRGVSYLSTTQDSLPVAGQALLNGISTRKVPMKGFKVVDYISFPLPKLCLAQLHRPNARRDSGSARRSSDRCELGDSRWARRSNFSREEGSPTASVTAMGISSPKTL